jgi:cyclophilin family peptidyl-prolyl cis-trans isomerase
LSSLITNQDLTPDFSLAWAVPGFAYQLPDGLLAEMETNKGKFVVRLYYDKAPMTVANFVGLAEGKMQWLDPRSGEIKAEPFYNGLLFHKVIPGIMVQGGDPKGNGNGGPGYIFQREFHPDLRHDRAGILSMLNEGPYSHGSQFFISLNALPFFDDRHSAFGEVIEGQEVLYKLEKGDRIMRVSILRQGRQAQGFDLENQLKQLRASVEKVSAEAKNAAQKKSLKPQGTENRKNLPALKGNIDPAKLPSADQPATQKVALEYLLITYKRALSPIQSPYYDRKGARKVAEHLCSLAREKDADFAKLIRDFSDLPDYKLPLLTRNAAIPSAYDAVFHLSEGHVSDPLETPQGFYVFKRVKMELVKVRHILISYQGAEGNTRTRTKRQAETLAQTVLNKALAGENFAELARKYSDSDTAKNGGLIGKIARGMTIPAFEQAAFSLEVNEISDITPTPTGFQIIKRIE